MKLAVSEPLASESNDWFEHRAGLIICGQKAGRYVAVQPSEHAGWDVQISQGRSSRGISDAYQRITDTRLQTILAEWDVRWLPAGIYAWAGVGRTHLLFQRSSVDPLSEGHRRDLLVVPTATGISG